MRKLTKLERAGLIEKVTTDAAEVEKLLELVLRDIKIAEGLIDMDLDWAFIAAYNAMLQGCLALMKAYGYRPKGANKHLAAIRFTREVLGEEWRSLLNHLDRIRKKRHRTVYETAGLISEHEAKETVKFAHKFADEIKQAVLDLLRESHAS